MLMGLFILSQQQRLTAEKRLAESEKKYRELVDTMLEGIWMADRERNNHLCQSGYDRNARIYP